MTERNINHPSVSVIMPVCNDEEWVALALESVLRQSLQDIELICVDDGSVDATPDILKEFATRDSRIKIITNDSPKTALQARKTGVLAASGEYIIFLDGDDTLESEACQRALQAAYGDGFNFDIVHFGTSICDISGKRGVAPVFEKSLQPNTSVLTGSDILINFFGRVDGKPPQGTIWNKMYRAEVARKAFQYISDDSIVPRANDICATFLILSQAESYTSIPERLYNYRFGAGGSMPGVLTRDKFYYYLEAVKSYAVISEYLDEVSSQGYPIAHGERMLFNTRRLLIEQIVQSWMRLERPTWSELEQILAHYPKIEVIAVLRQFPNSKSIVVRSMNESRESLRSRPHAIRHVAFFTTDLSIGGVQRVTVELGRALLANGFRVTIFIRRATPDQYDVPEGIDVVTLADGQTEYGTGDLFIDEMLLMANAVEGNDVDLIINQSMYRSDLVYFTLALKMLNVHVAITLHSFCLRDILDFHEAASYRHLLLQCYDAVFVLSPVDEYYWRSLGVECAHYAPNPIERYVENIRDELVDFSNIARMHLGLFSQQADREGQSENRENAFNQLETVLVDEVSVELSAPVHQNAKDLDLIWIGRLHDEVKAPRELVRILAGCVKLRPGTNLTIIGPEITPGIVKEMSILSESLGVSENIDFLPATTQISGLLQRARVFLNTSVIEGFIMTLVECGAMEIPVVMYDLPWLPLLQDNPGIITVPWGDWEKAAKEAVNLLNSPTRAASLGGAARISLERFSDYELITRYRTIFAMLENSDVNPNQQQVEFADIAKYSGIVERETRRLYGAMRTVERSKYLASRRTAGKLKSNLEAEIIKVGRHVAQERNYAITVDTLARRVADLLQTEKNLKELQIQLAWVQKELARRTRQRDRASRQRDILKSQNERY